MRVLVVDDSSVMRRIIIKALSTADITDVCQAADGGEAMEAVLGGSFDIILMDWNMPNLNGIDALRQLRASGVKTPVLMVTTEAEKVRVVDALRAGANNYLVKPFDASVLVDKVLETAKQAAP